MSILVGCDRRRLEELVLWLLEQRDAPVTVDRLVKNCEVLDAAHGALAYRLLVRAGALDEQEPARGARVVTAALVGLLIDTGCLIYGKGSLSPSSVELAWTLPKNLEPPAVTQGHDSIVNLIRSVIDSSRDRLWLVSPFIDDGGVEHIYNETASALRRGVSVIVVTHNLQDITSCNSQAVERLHRQALSTKAQFRAYSARVTRVAARQAHEMLHAKIVLADGKQAYVGSANLTGHGLQAHLEVGLRVHEPQATHIEMLLHTLIDSELVDRVLKCREDCL
jgi:phosphatidylserine/phosphatidylglycerophosphate/cardiolipin synthase-like enzyme